MYKVVLVNKDVGVGRGSLPFPVCGRSGKNYGVSFVDPNRGGPVFEMTLEEYDAAKFDLIGNPGFCQQWVPCFEEVAEVRETSPTAASNGATSRETSPRRKSKQSKKRELARERLVRMAKKSGIPYRGVSDADIIAQLSD